MRLFGILAFAILGSFATPLTAQVFEIDDAGAVNVRDGSGEVSWRASGAMRTAPVVAAAGFVSNVVPSTFAPLLHQVATRYALHPALLEALIWQESRWKSDAVSVKGALGLAQLMPATARELGVDAHDPQQNLDGGARYLRLMLNHFGGDLSKSLAAYNAGASRVARIGGIPQIQETRDYVAAIQNRLRAQGIDPAAL